MKAMRESGHGSAVQRRSWRAAFAAVVALQLVCKCAFGRANGVDASSPLIAGSQALKASISNARREYPGSVCRQDEWNATLWDKWTYGLKTNLRRAAPDVCQLRACMQSGEVNSIGCMYAYARRQSPITDNVTAVIYNKPLKCGSTTVYLKLREFYARDMKYVVGGHLDKEVLGPAMGTQIPDAKSRATLVMLAQKTKFWGWHIQLSERMREQYMQLRNNTRVFFLSSNRAPLPQVVSYFFEEGKHWLDNPNVINLSKLLKFIGTRGRNNNYAYHFDRTGEARNVNCSKLTGSPALMQAARSNIALLVKRYDWIFETDELNQDIVLFNEIFEVCPPIRPIGNLRPRWASTLIPREVLSGPEVRQAVKENMCLDTILFEEMAKRRAFLLRVYSGAHKWSGC